MAQFAQMGRRDPSMGPSAKFILCAALLAGSFFARLASAPAADTPAASSDTPAAATSSSAATTSSAQVLVGQRFELRKGDRVVLLGGTLIERAQSSGYWEAAMTTAYMNADVTFRNLGWSADTVFAESRGIFDAPAVGYARLFEQLRELKPTVVFIGYGANEAWGGREKLRPFLAQLAKLLDDIGALGARVVIVSPLREESHGPPLPDPAEYNARLAEYVDALKNVARTRGVPFVDFFAAARPAPGVKWTDNQIHLTEEGYRQTAKILAKQLGFPSTQRTIELNAGRGRKTAKGADVSVVRTTANHMLVLVSGDRLAESDCHLVVHGLPEGRYTLSIDKSPVLTASAKELEAGVEVTGGKDSEQYAALRRAIIEKNRLYFYRWRPQNTTYLFGFRKYEQGQNAKEVFVFDRLVAEAEAKIAELKYPDTRLYEIAPVKKAN